MKGKQLSLLSVTSGLLLALVLAVAVTLRGPLIDLDEHNRDTFSATQDALKGPARSAGQRMDEIAKAIVFDKANMVAEQLAILDTQARKEGRKLDFENAGVWSIAVQHVGAPLDAHGNAVRKGVKVGEEGYTCVYEQKTARMRAHPNPDYQGKIMHQFKDKDGLAEWWNVFRKSLEQQESWGEYLWNDHGQLRQKYMHIVPVPGTDPVLLVAATQYSDAFSKPVTAFRSEVKKELEDLRVASDQGAETVARKIAESFGILALIALSIHVGVVLYFRRFVRKVSQFTDHMALEEFESAPLLDKPLVSELGTICDRLTVLQKTLIRYKRERKEGKEAVAKTEATHKVLHDLKGAQFTIRELKLELSKGHSNSESVMDALEALEKNLEATIRDFVNPSDNYLTTVRKFDLSELLTEVVDPLRSSYGALNKNVQFDLQTPEEPVMVIGSKGNLRRALDNVVRNGAQAIKKIGRVSVSLTFDEANAHIRVKDDGPGIADTVKESLFTTGVTTRPGGSGLGLPVAKQVISGHGGTIGHDDNEPTGAIFRIQLPLPSAVEANPDAELETLEVPKGKQILVFDDLPEMLTKFYLAALSEGLLGEYYMSFEQGNRDIDWRDFSARFGLVIVDHVFSDDSTYDGISICDELARRAPEVPVVICTRNAEDKLIAYCRRAGIRIINKPYHRERVVRFKVVDDVPVSDASSVRSQL